MKTLKNYVSDIETRELVESLINMSYEGDVNLTEGFLGNMFKKLGNWLGGATDHVKAAGKAASMLKDDVKKKYNDALQQIANEKDAKKRQQFIDNFVEQAKKAGFDEKQVSMATMLLQKTDTNIANATNDNGAADDSKKKLEELVKQNQDLAKQLQDALKKAGDPADDGKGDGKDGGKNTPEQQTVTVADTEAEIIKDKKQAFADLAKAAELDGDGMQAWVTAQIKAMTGKDSKVDPKVKSQLTQKTAKDDETANDVFLGATVVLLGACIINNKAIFQQLGTTLVQESPRSSILKAVAKFKEEMKADEDKAAKENGGDKGGDQGGDQGGQA